MVVSEEIPICNLVLLLTKPICLLSLSPILEESASIDLPQVSLVLTLNFLPSHWDFPPLKEDPFWELSAPLCCPLPLPLLLYLGVYLLGILGIRKEDKVEDADD